MNSFFPTLIVNNYWLYVFIYMNKLWLIDWLIDCNTLCKSHGFLYLALNRGKKIKNVTFWKNSFCHSFLNKITDQSSQWRMFLEIDVPKKKEAKSLKNTSESAHFLVIKQLKTFKFTDFCCVQNFSKSVLTMRG